MGTLKKMKVIIIVLALLLGLCLACLAGVIVHMQRELANAYAVAPDNYITPSKDSGLDISANTGHFPASPILLYADLSGGVPMMPLAKTTVSSDSVKGTVISIYRNHAEESTPFNLNNMFPGDSETKVFWVEVSHKGTVTVRFHADVRSGYEKLAEVLKCKVELRGENAPLYDGLMRDMPQSINYRIASAGSKTTQLIYDITVYLDTSVGNEYMNRELVADFRWWVEENGGETPPTPPVTTAPSDTTRPKPDDTTRPVEPEDTTAPSEPEDTTGPSDPEDTTGPSEPEDTTGPSEPEDTTGPSESEDTTGPDESDDTTEPSEPDDTTGPDAPDTGELVDPPHTGGHEDGCSWFWIAIVIAIISMLINIILLSVIVWLKRQISGG